MSYTVTVPKGPLGPLQVRYSPTVTSTPVTVAGSYSTMTDAG
ncbi:hypothetical protein [Microbacterium sp.]